MGKGWSGCSGVDLFWGWLLDDIVAIWGEIFCAVRKIGFNWDAFAAASDNFGPEDDTRDIIDGLAAMLVCQWLIN